MSRDPLAMSREKLRRGLAGVIPGPIMNQKQMLAGVAHDHLQKSLVNLGVEPAFDALIEQTTRKIINGAIDLVAFAFATGGDFGLPSPPGPGITQGTPLGEAGLIFKQDHAFATLGGPQNGRPLVPQPSLPLGLVEMVRDKAGFLKRKAQIVEQRTDIMPVVEHAKLPPDEHANEDRIPTGGLKADHQRPGIEQLDQAFLLRRGQLLGATAAMAVDQAVEPPQQEGFAP